MIFRLAILIALVLSATVKVAFAQYNNSTPSASEIAAKELFHSKRMPTASPARAIGSYSNGCLAGAEKLPISGERWQVMRLSRNRNWGHPDLIKVIKRIATKTPTVGWRGLLIGDIAQPRGGPMLTGHASHQIGLDVDIWFIPMPRHSLSRNERESMAATSIVMGDWGKVKQAIWSPSHVGILEIAAEDPDVERVFVNRAIKQALCREIKGDRKWLSKIRPWYGHGDHFHVRIKCPAADGGDCKSQPPPADNDGCGEDLAWWFSDEAQSPKTPPEPPRVLKLSDLPAACRDVVNAP